MRSMWPFKRRHTDPAPQGLPPALESITADTPRRFSLILARPDAADGAIEVLGARLGAELTITTRRDGDGRPVLDLVSTFTVGNAAVLRPLNQLHRGGVAVAGLEMEDLITEVDDDALARIIEDWAVNANTGPYRTRLERLAGDDLLQRTAAVARTAPADTSRRRSAWWLAVKCIVFNTHGAEAWAVAEAARTTEKSVALSLIDAAIDRVQLVRLAGMPASVPNDALEKLLRRPGYLAERACHLVWHLRDTVDPAVAEALRGVVTRGGEAATAALAALHAAEPTDELRATVDAALASSEPEVSAAALAILAQHWPADARPVWREFLASRSAALRITAESVIGLHGGEEDLADAAAQLKKISRSTGTDSWPPRGHEIVDLLVRHRAQPVARTALDDLTARWPRLRDDLRRWLVAEHPELQPSDDAPPATGATPMSDEPEGELTWSPPRMARDGDTVGLTFDEAAAHAPPRDRFEELLDADASFDVLESDREFVLVRAGSPDAEARLLALWDEASQPR
jgi:hypothetical protein